MKLKKRREKRKRWHLVWVDWLILLLVAAAIFVGLRYLQKRRNASTPTVRIRYTLCLSDREGGIAEYNGGWEDLIPVGSAVTSSKGTARLGTVAAVSVQPHVAATLRDGEIVFEEVPDRFDVYVTVRGTAIANIGDGLRINDIRIAAGDVGDYRLGGFLALGANVISVVKEGG